MPKQFSWVILPLLCVLFFVGPPLAFSATVFVYHRFGDERYPSTNIDLDVFRSQLDLLKAQNYTVMPLGEIVSHLESGGTFPEKTASLTVDDAYYSFLTGALPLLQEYGYKATLFVNTDAVGAKGYLSWDDLRAISKVGIEIGNHSASHPYMVNRKQGESEAAWNKRILADIRKAQSELTLELGVEPQLFAYPYGEYSPDIVEIVRSFGFKAAAAQQSGVIDVGVDRFTLPRFPMGGPYATLDDFTTKLSMKALPVDVLFPQSPIVDKEDPPLLVIDIQNGEVDLSRLRCFVQGQEEATITPDPIIAGRYRIQAKEPLSGRRNKYTLTAPGIKDGQWYWFSQLWIKR
ncbi:polysaccharide deacetylase family protein [Desulfuromonas sp. AOP6]|uniref:polysaccharide deacetylase family protein n=1 Tax=Desulfuromonas sp. AOP6 TaxID=1566351 RepID=UPI0012866E61|nr:polysaccharide deacetylase family protein [Desulfuromonas sp. AOP6]BCA79827.1 polysaccharide deacetylase [Desulfuromonas sp. AOP6]